jgi:hypothetical protein
MRFGGYQRTGPDSDSLESERQLFLSIARQCDQRIMIDLIIGPSRLYNDLVRNYTLSYCNGNMSWEQFQAFLPDWKTVELEAKSAPVGSPLLAFREALLEWSVKWHLDADWCRDRAIRAMRLWGYNKAAKRYLCWNSSDLWNCVQERLKIIDQLSEDEQEFLRSLVNDPGAFGPDDRLSGSKGRDNSIYSLIYPKVPRPKSKLLPMTVFPLQTLDSYLKMAREHLEEHPSLSSLTEAKRRDYINKLLDGPGRSYYKQVERYFGRQGWKQTRQQPEHVKYVIWAVYNQVLGIKPSQIAAGPPLIETKAVSQAISRVLKRIGLRNRKSPGRPPLTKSS